MIERPLKRPKKEEIFEFESELLAIIEIIPDRDPEHIKKALLTTAGDVSMALQLLLDDSNGIPLYNAKDVPKEVQLQVEKGVEVEQPIKPLWRLNYIPGIKEKGNVNAIKSLN
eukprot:TRINITY_DN7807_c0_g2_i1.p1 TRINITY_DN7807_c0_g2~~TRINITY_DN7807_c0_g2_i1.p1  ORF type:complete len:113 (-),score=43.86 TRINITY_DN7807_c0_g2_i1:191-529(-)